MVSAYFRTLESFYFFVHFFHFESAWALSFFHHSFGFKTENKNKNKNKNCFSWLTSPVLLPSLSLKDQNRDTVVQALASARFVLFYFFTLLFRLSQSEGEIRSEKIRF